MVEWKKLGDVCDFQNGFAFKSTLFKEYGFPIVRITNIMSNSVDLTDCKYFDLGDYSKNNLIPYKVCSGDILLAMSGATTGKIGIYKEKQEAYINQRVGKFIPKTTKICNRFLYHNLISQTNKMYIMAGGGAQPNLSSNKLMEELFLPIPSLEEQNRIVGILDTFTDSIENLKQQIAQRRKQFEFYRDLYINMSFSKWPTITLKDIAVIKNGKDYKDLSTGNVPVYGSGGIMTFVNAFASDKPSVLLPRKGSVENIFYVDKPFWTVDTIYWTDIDTNRIEPKFLFYSLSKYDLKKFAYGGARPSLSQPILYKLEIPLPPLSEQQRIVSILDTFEASISNLEAQLAQRQKQYEYYRNQLLTFE